MNHQCLNTKEFISTRVESMSSHVTHSCQTTSQSLHNIYDIDKLYPTIDGQQFRDCLNPELTQLVYTYFDFVLSKLKKTYTASEKMQLKVRMKYIYNHLINDIPHEYNYTQKDYTIHGIKYGRLFSSTSIQGIKSQIRNTIVDKHKCVDIDMVNAHPTILKQLCQTLNINTPILNQYVDNRDILLKEIQREYKIDRDEAKTIPLSVMNGGIRSYKYRKIAWLKDFENEMTAVYQALLNTNIGKEVLRDVKNHHKTNIQGSVISHCINKPENEILAACVKYLKSKNIDVYTLCFDGMIAANTPNNILDELTMHVQAQLGLTINFSFKTFDNDLGQEIIKELYNRRDNNITPDYILHNIERDNKRKPVQGVNRRLLGNRMFESEKTVKSHIEKWLKGLYNIRNIQVRFDGESFILDSHLTKGRDLPCYCSTPQCLLYGNVKFQINWNLAKKVTAFRMSEAICKDRSTDITSMIDIHDEILSKYNDELYDAKKIHLQLPYTYDNVEVIPHYKCEVIDFTNVQSPIIFQSGCPGYGKTWNVFKYIYDRCITEKDLVCVIISNTAVQNVNFCNDEFLKDKDFRVLPIIHCMGNTIKTATQQLQTDPITKQVKTCETRQIKALINKDIKYPITGNSHIYIVNSKSYADCVYLQKHIDILFVDEFTQVLNSVATPNETRKNSIHPILLDTMRKAKKLFISDIVYTTEMVDLIRELRNDHITHYLICDSRMKFDNILYSDDTVKLAQSMKSDRPKFVSSNSRTFIEWAYHDHVRRFGKDKCVLIVGKDHDVDINDRLQEIQEKTTNTQDKPYIFCSPAVSSSISIQGERDIVSVRLFDVLSRTDSLNAAMRPRQSKNIQFFDFASEYEKPYPPISKILTAQEAALYNVIKSVSHNIDYVDLIAKTVCKAEGGKFDAYYLGGQYRKLLAQNVGYQMISNTDPVIQTWLSDRYGLKMVDELSFYHVIYKLNEDLRKNGFDQIDFIRNHQTNKMQFTFNDKVYTFDNMDQIISEVETLKKKLKQLKETRLDKRVSITTILHKIKTPKNYRIQPFNNRNLRLRFCKHVAARSNKIRTDLLSKYVQRKNEIEEEHSFSYDFYKRVKPARNNMLRIINQNLRVVIQTQNYTESSIKQQKYVKTTNVNVANMTGTLQEQYQKLIDMKEDDAIDVHTYAAQIYKIYNLACKETSMKKSVLITRDEGEKKGIKIIKTFHHVTNNREYPFNTLINKEYNHKDTTDFIKNNKLDTGSTKLTNLINYRFKSQNTKEEGIQIRKKTLTRVNKNDIHVELFDKNNNKN